jgi:hypothetical protein
MKYVVGPAVIEVPDELVDRTGYVFEAPAPEPAEGEEPRAPDRITVSKEPMPPDVAPADLVAHQRARIEGYPGLSVTVTTAEIQGQAVRASTLHAVAPAEGFEILFAAFRWPPELIASIDFENQSRKDAAAVFSRAVESVRDASSAQAPSPGAVVRYAGDIAFDLPPDFRAPRTYLFMPEDERARLLITNDEATPGPLEFETLLELEGFGDRLHVEELERTELVTRTGLRGQLSRHRLERRGAGDAVLEARLVHRFVVRVKERAWLSIVLVEASDGDLGASHFDEIARSIAPLGRALSGGEEQP